MPLIEDHKPGFAIHTLWVYGELGQLENLCLRSWVRLGYKVILHSYDRPVVPDGVELFDASDLIPRSQIFTASGSKSLAVFSDVYRITIMKHFDALWLDADIFLIRYFDFSEKNILAYESDSGLSSINNALLRLEPDHPVVEEIIGRFQNPLRGVPWKRPLKAWPFLRRSFLSLNLHAKHLPWGALGRLAIKDVLEKRGFDGTILPSEYCLTALKNPLFEEVKDPEKYIREPLLYVHFYKSSIRNDIRIPSPGSIYEILWRMVQDK